MAIQFNTEDNGMILVYAGDPKLEGETVDRSWYVGTKVTYPTIAAYLNHVRISGKVIADTQFKNGETRYTLKNGGEVIVSRNYFGSLEIRVSNCPKELFEDLDQISTKTRQLRQ